MDKENTPYRHCGKRFFDLMLTVPALFLLAPVMAVIAILVRIKIVSSVIYRQKRPGLNGKPFTFYKFRTMSDNLDVQGNLLPDEHRLTILGEFLRKTSLDELPELWNVIKGDISLVGPRPLLIEYLDRYTPEQTRRHEVRPGITGWAQVNGRKKFVLDTWYVDHEGLCLALRILALTFLKVLKRKGVSPKDQMIMPRFTDTKTKPYLDD